jgi:hypothetical protein
MGLSPLARHGADDREAPVRLSEAAQPRAAGGMSRAGPVGGEPERAWRL